MEAATRKEFIATFRAGPRTRRSEVASVLIYSFLLFLTLGVALFFLLDAVWEIDVRDKPRFLWVVVGAPLLICVVIAWLWGQERCVFFIGLDETHLQVGDNPGRRIPYEKLEMVTLAVRPAAAVISGVSDSMMEFQGEGFCVHASIEPEDRYKCAALLCQKCPDALFVDELGRDYLALNVPDPRRVLSRSAAYHRKRGWSGVFASAVSALLVGVVAYGPCTGEGLNGFDWFWLAIGGLGLITEPFSAVHHFRSAKRVRGQSVRTTEK